ncbi:MAG TPA: outer membrane beta-barrel protein [Chryseosolibacter sp.]
MRTTHFWNKLSVHSAKVIFVLVLLFAALHSEAQQRKTSWVKRNNPNYDNKKLTYGFLIGLHSTAYQIKYSDRFVSQEFDTLYAVEPDWSPGFALGFIMNYKVADLLDLRLTPTVAFYEHTLLYRYTDDQPNQEERVETTMVELPLLLKFKSERRENLRMYMIGGIKPAIEASGKKDLKNVTSELEVTGGNLSLDVGFGLDIYYPLFKFSPELRFSRGMVNVLDNTTNIYGQPLQRVNTNTISLYLLFQ